MRKVQICVPTTKACNYSRVRSVALGVDGGQLPTLLDADVQAPRREVVYEAKLHITLHRHRPVPAT